MSKVRLTVEFIVDMDSELNQIGENQYQEEVKHLLLSLNELPGIEISNINLYDLENINE